MSTGYGWEGLRQVCATLLGARHVPERVCGGLGYLGRYNKCSPLPFLPFTLAYAQLCRLPGLALVTAVVLTFTGRDSRVETARPTRRRDQNE